jgi:transcription initiation factor TFIID TATA-box-binding protein
MSEFEVVNVAGTVDFQQRIALSPLANSLSERDEVNRVEYDPSELHLIHSWFFEDDTYVAFYKNGTCVTTGAGSLDRFYEVSDAVGDAIEDIVDLEIETYVTLTNIVSTAKIENLPSLETVAIGLGLNQTEYEPEQFPGLIHRGQDAVILIFASGKIVCTGVTNLEQISSAIEDITARIEKLAIS